MPPKKSKGELAINLAGAVAAGLKKALMYKSRVGLSNWARSTLATRKAVLSKNKTKRAARTGVSRVPVAKGEGIETSFQLVNPETPAVAVMKKINSVNSMFYQEGRFQAWETGRQSVSDQLMFGKNDFLNLLSQIPARDLSANANRRFLIDKFNSELTIANGTNATCYVHVYDITPKVDIDTIDITNGIGGPAVCWQTGELQQGNASGYHVIGSDPKKVDLFRQHFKVLNHTKHFMKPGDIHKHHVKINFNKIVNEARIQNSMRYAGVSVYTMLVCYGTPAQDDSAVPVVSTTAGQINWTQTNRYTYRYSLDNQSNNFISAALLPQPAILDVVQEDGDIDVVTNA